MHSPKARLHLQELEPRALPSTNVFGHALPAAPAFGAALVHSAREASSALLASPASTAATDALSGIEISPGIILGNVRHGATFVGHAAGQLPGVWAVSINYTPPHPGPGVTNTIVGGSWSLAVFSNGTFEGIVYGSVPDGTVTWNAAGTVASISADLTVLGGTGAFVGATGTGTFTGTLSHLTFPPTIGGTLSLSFSP
jgi:hypothetical protein